MNTSSTVLTSSLRTLVLAVGIGAAALAPMVIGAQMSGNSGVVAEQGSGAGGAADPKNPASVPLQPISSNPENAQAPLQYWAPVAAPSTGHLN